MASMLEQIEDKLSEALVLDHIEVVNESGNHNVPDGAESHFRVTLVAAEFESLRLIERHRRINAVLAAELRVIHALALHTWTAAEWSARHGEVPMSPPCAKR